MSEQVEAPVENETAFEHDGGQGEGSVEANPLGILATPEIKLPPRQPEVHQGEVVSVTPQQYDSGARAIRFNLRSLNNGAETNYDVFVPEAAWENPYITSAEIGKLPAPEGKVQTPKEQWGRAKQEVENVLRIALAQGRTIPTDQAQPTNGDEYTALVDNVCAGIQIVYRAAPDKNPSDPRFARTLRVRGIYEPEAATNPKLFKGHVKRWENPVDSE